MLKKPKYLIKLLNWLRRPGRLMRFIPMAKAKSNASLPATQPGTLLSSTFHQSIETLKYKTFLEIQIDGDVSRLKIEGDPHPDILTLAWYEIQLQYSDAVKTPKTNSLLQLSNKILKTMWQMTMVDNCIVVLKRGYDKEAAGYLFELGYSLIEENKDWTEYLKQVISVETQAKVLIVMLNQYQIEYKMMNPASNDLVKRTMVDYEKELRIVAKVAVGAFVKAGDITTMEFISMLNAYIEHNELLKEPVNG